MTDRIKGFVVTLDTDYREDDIEELRKAIGCFRGVIHVGALVRNPDDFINRQRVDAEWTERIQGLLTKLWEAKHDSP